MPKSLLTKNLLHIIIIGRPQLLLYCWHHIVPLSTCSILTSRPLHSWLRKSDIWIHSIKWPNKRMSFCGPNSKALRKSVKIRPNSLSYSKMLKQRALIHPKAVNAVMSQPRDRLRQEPSPATDHKSPKRLILKTLITIQWEPINPHRRISDDLVVHIYIMRVQEGLLDLQWRTHKIWKERAL
jgi:hypothetical protein